MPTDEKFWSTLEKTLVTQDGVGAKHKRETLNELKGYVQGLETTLKEQNDVLETHLEEARAAVGDIVRKLNENMADVTAARRWNALMNSARIRMLGGARFGLADMLLGIEFYAQFPADAEPGEKSEEARRWLTTYADIAYGVQNNHAMKIR